jgi:hypothetical protein
MPRNLAIVRWLLQAEKQESRCRMRDRCITGEKWFASGESKIFRISGNQTNSLMSNIFRLYHISSEKDFEPRRSHFSKVSS